jgi:imidazolonepropionase-like amidohydrolase
MVRLRSALAVLALATLGVLALLLAPRAGEGPPGSERLGIALLLLLLPLLWALVALLLRRPAGRWLGLAVGVAVLPWATAFTLGPSYGASTWPALVALAAALILLVTLTGRAMFEAYEGRQEVDWSGFRKGLLRWTLIFNAASAFSLYLFVTAYDADLGGFVAAGAWLLLGLVLGVWLLANQKTFGFLILAAACIAFIPLGALFLAREAHAPEEAWLLVAVFLPGVLMGWASMIAFGGPILRFLGSAAVIGVLSVSTLSSPPRLLAQREPATVVIRDVSVVHVERGTVEHRRNVTVQDGKISAITDPGSIPAGARVIDGSDGFLIPGLWDMHGHVLPATRQPTGEWWEPDYESAFKLLVANGVTGVRDMWGTLEIAARVRDERARTQPAWPRLLTAGGIVDGPEPFHPGLISVGSASEARWAVDSLLAGGASFIKVYSALPADLYREVVRHATLLGVAVAGHVPSAVRAADAAVAGQRSFEHLYGVLEGCSTDETALIADNIRYLDERAAHRSNPADDRAYFERLLSSQGDHICSELVDLLAERQVWQVPTLAAHRGVFRLQEAQAADDPRLAYVHPTAQAQWQPGSYDETRSFAAMDWDLRRRRWERLLAVVREMNAAGVPILAGSDFHPTLAFTFAGFGLHEELELLVEAGLSPAEALRTATLNPALYLEATDSLGTIAPGMAADLVLLDANPLEDIRNTRSIRGVSVGGRWLNRGQLDDLLEDVADHYRTSVTRPPAQLPQGAERIVDVVGSSTGLRFLFLVDPEILDGNVPGFLSPLTAADLSAFDASAEAFLTTNPQYTNWVLAGLDVSVADSVRIDGKGPNRRAEATWWIETRGDGSVPEPLPEEIETRVELAGWNASRSPGTRVSGHRFGSGTWAFGIESATLRVDAVCTPGGARAPVGASGPGTVLIWQGGAVPDRYTVRAPGVELVRDCDLRLSAVGLHRLAVALREARFVRGTVLGARLVESRGERRGVYRVD